MRLVLVSIVPFLLVLHFARVYFLVLLGVGIIHDLLRFNLRLMILLTVISRRSANMKSLLISDKKVRVMLGLSIVKYLL